MSVAFGIWALTCSWLGMACEEEAIPAPVPDPVPLEVAPGGDVELPSGLIVRLQETRLEPIGVPTQSVGTVRLRYVGKQLADRERFGFARIEGDFTHLCANFGLATRARSAPAADQIIISMSSEPTTFGETAPNVVQYIDSFAVQDGACIWEGL